MKAVYNEYEYEYVTYGRLAYLKNREYKLKSREYNSNNRDYKGENEVKACLIEAAKIDINIYLE